MFKSIDVRDFMINSTFDSDFEAYFETTSTSNPYLTKLKGT